MFYRCQNVINSYFIVINIITVVISCSSFKEKRCMKQIIITESHIDNKVMVTLLLKLREQYVKKGNG